MKTISYSYEYEYMPVEKRYEVLPERSVCSIKPAAEGSDYFYTGNGSLRMDIAGHPYRDKIVVTQELLYEPQWAKTPNVPDLRPYMADIRKSVLEGKPELADKLIDQAQREAGHDQYMNLDAKIVYPIGSLHVHKAFDLTFAQPEKPGTHDYLRWLDMLSGKVTAHWENECGVYESESLAVYDGDFTATRLTAPEGMLDVSIDFHYPQKGNHFGQPSMQGSTNTLEKSTDMFKLAFAYNPEYGHKGYVSVIRFVQKGGSCEVIGDGIKVTGADSLIILSKTVRFENDFRFECADPVAESFMQVEPDFDSFVESNKGKLGERMNFSRTYPHYCWTGCLGWIYNEFWGYYLCTDDKEFLRTRIVPALKEIALFFEDYACDRDERGKVIFYPSFSPEDPTPNPDYITVTCKSINPTRINSVMDIAICREVLTNLIDACNVLGIEQQNMEHCREQLESLPDYVLDEGGGLKEWAWTDIEENYNHRHVSHHYDLWPGRAVFPDTEPEIAEAIRISNRKRGQQDDSAHGIIHRALCAIRLKDMEEFEQNLSQLICHGFVRCNLSTTHFPYRGQFPDLQGAMPAILLEMCVFSRPGVVEFLPAVPDYYPTGKIYGIWLYTWAKLNSMEWNEEGITVRMISFREQSLTLRCPKKATAFEINCKPMAIENNAVTYNFAKDEEVSITMRY